MSGDNGTPGGDAPPGGEIPTEELSRMEAMILEQTARGIAQQLHDLNPNLSPELLLRCAVDALQVHKQQHLQPVLEDAMAASPERTAKPLWGFHLLRKGKVVGDLKVRKDVGAVARENPKEFIGYLMVYGLLTNPLLYALAKAHGFELAFQQGREKSKILI